MGRSIKYEHVLEYEFVVTGPTSILWKPTKIDAVFHFLVLLQKGERRENVVGWRGGPGMKRKLLSPGSVDQENLRKKTAPDKEARVRLLLAEVYNGIVTNEFVQQDIKDATKEMRALILDLIQTNKAGDKGEERKTKRVFITMEPIEELMKKRLIICWPKRRTKTTRKWLGIYLRSGRFQEMLKRSERVLVQREEIVLIDGANPNAQPPKKCLLLASSEWDGGQNKIKEDLKTIVKRIEEDNIMEYRHSAKGLEHGIDAENDGGKSEGHHGKVPHERRPRHSKGL